MKTNRKGFTLVELLAVIVILAIILAIAIPGISGIINSAKRGAFESDVKMIITGIEYKVLEAQTDSTVTAPTVGVITTTVDDYGANPANYGLVEITSMEPIITVSVTSLATSEFGALSTTGATKSSVTIAP